MERIVAVLKVVKYPHKVLKSATEPVLKITSVEQKLVKDMIDTMYAESGIGLAANQVGVSKQIFVASPDQVKGNELVFFNPVIFKKDGIIKEFEGCLSVPEFYEPVRRAKSVWLRAMNLSGKIVEVKASGLLSRIFQHEVDHLNGTLFVDRLGFVKSRLTKARLNLRLAKKK